MGIRAKFNILLACATLLGMVLFTLASEPLVNAVAREQVLQSSRIMMESAAGARKYTTEQIIPLIKADLVKDFRPQAVAAYAAKRNFDVIHAKFSDYSYREAALNPTNLEDRAADWEADIINDFREHPGKAEIAIQRNTATGPALELARPLVSRAACLQCHSTPSVAPASMVAIYGAQNGFGWKPNEIIGAQIVSVPMTVPSLQAGRVRFLFLAPFVCFCALLFICVNVLLNLVVVGPVERIAKTAEIVSMGDMSAPEYRYDAKDQLGQLSASFNRMRRSLHEAMQMLGDD